MTHVFGAVSAGAGRVVAIDLADDKLQMAKRMGGMRCASTFGSSS